MLTAGVYDENPTETKARLLPEIVNAAAKENSIDPLYRSRL
jgi:hypothetical protein